MFMKIQRAGLLDSFQDAGRIGLAELGVGQGGWMDSLSAALANILAGNDREEAVLEMHFPAAQLSFQAPVSIALSGADFDAAIDGVALPLNRRINLPAGSEIVFRKKINGQRCYLAIEGGWDLPPVLNSVSTLLKSGLGGWQGRALKKHDKVPLKFKNTLLIEQVKVSPFFVAPYMWYRAAPFHVFPGPEWDWLSAETQKQIMETAYTITPSNDRMGYRLAGAPLEMVCNKEMKSSGVLPGTLQRLPNGQPLVLTADAQTTGGYPRVLQIAAVDLSRLAQLGTGDSLWFSFIEMDKAVQLMESQQQWLQQTEVGMRFQISGYS
jgi:antagonist of KipI